MEPLLPKKESSFKRGSVMVGTKTKKNIKIAFEINIRFLFLEAPDDTPVTVHWISGKKQQKTKTKMVKDNVTKINGKFAMSTTVEFDLLKQLYTDKITRFEACIGSGEDLKKVGSAELNIASYTTTQNVIEKFMLEPIDDYPLSENAHLEVRVTTKESGDSASKEASEMGRKQSIMEQLAPIMEDDGMDRGRSESILMQTTQIIPEVVARRQSTLSETPDQAFVMEQEFQKQEVIYQKQVRDLEKRLREKQDQMREATLELSVTFDKKLNTYQHIDEADREVMLKKDVQVQLLRDRIKQLQVQKVSMMRTMNQQILPEDMVRETDSKRNTRIEMTKVMQQIQLNLDSTYQANFSCKAEEMGFNSQGSLLYNVIMLDENILK